MAYKSDRELAHMVMKQLRALGARVASLEEAFQEALLAQAEEVARREAREEADMPEPDRIAVPDELALALEAAGVPLSALDDLKPGAYFLGPNGLQSLDSEPEEGPENPEEADPTPCDCPACTLRQKLQELYALPFEKVSKIIAEQNPEDFEKTAATMRAFGVDRDPFMSEALRQNADFPTDHHLTGENGPRLPLDKYRRKPKDGQAEAMQKAWAGLTDAEQMASTVGKPRLSDLVRDLEKELNFATSKFPGDNVTFAALVEEVGELATALFSEDRAKVRKEAMQVAVMAFRVILDGDHTFEPWRRAHGLDKLRS